MRIEIIFHADLFRLFCPYGETAGSVPPGKHIPQILHAVMHVSGRREIVNYRL